jgi:hypothetical protein
VIVRRFGKTLSQYTQAINLTRCAVGLGTGIVRGALRANRQAYPGYTRDGTDYCKRQKNAGHNHLATLSVKTVPTTTLMCSISSCLMATES